MSNTNIKINSAHIKKITYRMSSILKIFSDSFQENLDFKGKMKLKRLIKDRCYIHSLYDKM